MILKTVSADDTKHKNVRRYNEVGVILHRGLLLQILRAHITYWQRCINVIFCFYKQNKSFKQDFKFYFLCITFYFIICSTCQKF